MSELLIGLIIGLLMVTVIEAIIKGKFKFTNPDDEWMDSYIHKDYKTKSKKSSNKNILKDESVDSDMRKTENQSNSKTITNDPENCSEALDRSDAIGDQGDGISIQVLKDDSKNNLQILVKIYGKTSEDT